MFSQIITQIALSRDTRLIIAIAFYILLLVIAYFVYKHVFKVLKKVAKRTESEFDDIVLDLFEIPGMWFLFWVLLKIFSNIFFDRFDFFRFLNPINNFLLIFSIAWIATQLVKAGSYLLQKKLLVASDNIHKRKSLTQLKVFQSIINTIIIIVAFALFLLTFDKAKTIGMSLLTSAGVIGVIVGLAAQKSLGMILAGIQIAITQPIKLDDAVVVEGEWGHVEEITLTYVVLKLWDERRLILPITYFLEKPFQNWTRTSNELLGTVVFFLDYNFPVDEIRKLLPQLIDKNSNWDRRVANVEVTNNTELYKEIRILVSSSDSSKKWNLCTEIREKVIEYINKNYPDSFMKYKLELKDLTLSAGQAGAKNAK